MGLYAAFDLHSSNSYLGISDEKGKRIFKKKLPNDSARIKEALRPLKDTCSALLRMDVPEANREWKGQ